MTDLAVLLDNVEAAIGDAATMALDVMPTADGVDAVLATRARLFDLQQTFSYLVEVVDGAIIRLHPYDPEREPVLLPGGGNVKITGGNIPKRYDIPAIESALVEVIREAIPFKAAIDDSGEMTGIRDVVAPVVRAAIDAAGADAPSFTNFRAGVFKKLGLDLKRYMTEAEKSPLKVVIFGRGKEGT